MTREIPLPNMNDLMAQVVLDNPEIRKRLESLLMMLIDDMEHVLRAGYRPHILPLQKAILPGLLRSLQTTQNAAQESTERAAFERLIQSYRGSINVPEHPEDPVT